jgi:hypothetical protein
MSTSTTVHAAALDRIARRSRRADSKRQKAKAARLVKQAHAEASKRPTVSPETRARLYDEAMNSSAFEGMSADEIKTEIDQRISIYLNKMPAWFGKTQSADARSRAAMRTYRIQRGLIAAGEQPEALRRHREDLKAFHAERERVERPSPACEDHEPAQV